MATTAHKPLEQSSMSALGQKQTLAYASVMSALPPKADITQSGRADAWGFGLCLPRVVTLHREDRLTLYGVLGAVVLAPTVDLIEASPGVQGSGFPLRRSCTAGPIL